MCIPINPAIPLGITLEKQSKVLLQMLKRI